jgi:hypothetical protein
LNLTEYRDENDGTMECLEGVWLENPLIVNLPSQTLSEYNFLEEAQMQPQLYQTINIDG